MIALVKIFEEISLTFYEVFGNYMLSLCLMLITVLLLTFPFQLKEARRSKLLIDYNIQRLSVLAEVSKKYNNNPMIINRMRYEYDKLNKPKRNIFSIVSVVIRLLSVVVMAILPFYPPNCITGEQAEIFGASIFEPPSREFDFSAIIVGLYLFFIVVRLFKSFNRAFSKQGKSKAFSWIMCLIESLSAFACTIFSLKVFPIGTTLFYIVYTVLMLLENKLTKYIVEKKAFKHTEIQYKTVDLYQFEDLKEELLKEEGARSGEPLN